MSDKRIETRIREHYVAETGEWLVEKGKVKEAKLLKEACETIESLRRTVARLEKSVYAQSHENYKKGVELAERAKAVEELENRLHERLNSAKQGLEYLLENLK